ncbi:MAG: hypothetical protein LBT46_13565 [Planctomycetaceae bacterium]|jgi:hypothetical protein|nr:hypothetical protein [Planctomycetaceae bacterium]
MYKPRKKPVQDAAEISQDSFLDVVSNIVGILIILVMVAGIRAQYSADVSQETDEPTAALIEQMQIKQATVYALRRDIAESKMKQEIVGEQIHYQAEQYAVLFDRLTTARAAIDTAAEEQSQDVKKSVEYQRQLAETNVKLEELNARRTWLMQQTRPKAAVIENIPAPLAKTVEEKEIHFRLLGKKVAYVPWIELMDKMRADITGNQEKYFKAPSSTGKTAPVDGFEMDFMLGVFNVPAREGFGKVLSLQYAEMRPLSENIGEPLETVLSSSQSLFLQKLSLFRSDIYTATFWVYPDSFEEYQTLKQILYEKGYKVAARPMVMGEVISGSPHGTKSASQ